MLWLTGRIVRLPESREGVTIKQYIATGYGPIFQAGTDGYLVQVTYEFKPWFQEYLGDAITPIPMFILPACSALCSDRRTDPIFYIVVWLASIVGGILMFTFGNLASLFLSAAIWGKKIEGFVSIREELRPVRVQSRPLKMSL